MDWVSRNWPQLTSATAGILAFDGGFLDAETAGHLGMERDWNLILMGLTALGVTGLSLVPRAAAFRRR